MEYYDDNMLRQYLLGRLPEGEAREALDELSIVDDEFVARLGAVESDLIDSYTRGELDGRERTQFELQYLASPHLREKVRFAQAFQSFAEKRVMAKAATVATVATAIPAQESRLAEPEPPRQSDTESTPWRRSVRARQWGFAAAAMLLLLAFGWLVFETLRLRNQTNQAQAERAALRQHAKELEAQLEQQRSAHSETERELRRAREQYAQLEQERALEKQRAKSQPPSLPASLAIVSFDLAPAGPRSDRGVNDQIAAVTVPPGTNYVSLQLDLPPNQYLAYRAELRPGGKERIVWRKLEAGEGGIGKAINISLRADRLKPQEYTIKVMSISAHGSEELAEYQFRVEK